MPRLLLVANPAASGFTGGHHREVVDILRGTFDVVPVWPDGPDAAEAEARAAAAAGFEVVVAMGGDGVVHRVANGLAYTGTALGVIPSGTTNVFARVVGVPSGHRRAARALTRSRVAAMPLAHLATDDGTPGRYATFACGIGFDADTVERAERRPTSKLRLGSVHYATSAATELARYRCRRANLAVEAAGRRAHGVAAMVQVQTPYTYFGRIPLRLTRRRIDGLAALIVERLTVPRAAGLVARAITGRSIDRVAGAALWTGFDKIVIESDPDSAYQADGELLGRAGSLEVTPALHALLTLVPERADPPDVPDRLR